MKRRPLQSKTLALLAVVIPLVALFAYVALRSGPLAPVPVTVSQVRMMAITPSIYGIGTVEARYLYKIGPTATGRLQQLHVDVGDVVPLGEVLGQMDPVDLADRVRALEAELKRGEAQFKEAQARYDFARSQLRRYEQLLVSRSTSEESVTIKRQELQVAEAGLSAAREGLGRARAEIEALGSQQENLVLKAPVSGLVVARLAEPGTTLSAGQAVVEMVDPGHLWIDLRVDQISAQGLRAGLAAQVRLRSRKNEILAGRIERIEPRADAVTEELLAKVMFDALPNPLPPLGELAEVTVLLAPLPESLVIPNAALRSSEGQAGVWVLTDEGLEFRPIRTGRGDLDGHVQVLDGLTEGERIVVYSEKPLHERSTVYEVDRLPGVPG